MITPISKGIILKYAEKYQLKNLGRATIRQIFRLINDVEEETGEQFIRMEMGIPGIKPSEIAITAEKAALDNNCAAIYPPSEGIFKLKEQISKFVKNFLDVDVAVSNCVPTVGSIMAAYVVFMVAGKRDKLKDTVLFLDPGFPVHKQQVKMLGLKEISFDIYNFRGDKLEAKLEEALKRGNISTILYSNPNNPAWFCFNESELKVIGEMATKYDVVVAEDLAYIGMDFRKNISMPGIPPYQSTVAKYTDNYALIISSSKSFSYAGQRIGFLAVSDNLSNRHFENLLQFYPFSRFGDCISDGAVYATTGGVAHSVQHGMAALLDAVNQGNYYFVDDVKIYGEKAQILKEIFARNGFDIVYSQDIDQPIADGFYFTVSFPGYSGEELVEELLSYGISTVALSSTGSSMPEGIRISVSKIDYSQFKLFESRIELFYNNNKGRMAI